MDPVGTEDPLSEEQSAEKGGKVFEVLAGEGSEQGGEGVGEDEGDGILGVGGVGVGGMRWVRVEWEVGGDEVGGGWVKGDGVSG